MSTYTITITTTLEPDHYVVTATAVGTDTLPSDIFVYENLGTSTLGSYYGVCSYLDYGRFQHFNGTPIPTFGNRFVKTSTATILVPLDKSPESVKAKIVSDITKFKNAFLISHTSTQVYTV